MTSPLTSFQKSLHTDSPMCKMGILPTSKGYVVQVSKLTAANMSANGTTRRRGEIETDTGSL